MEMVSKGLLIAAGQELALQIPEGTCVVHAVPGDWNKWLSFSQEVLNSLQDDLDQDSPSGSDARSVLLMLPEHPAIFRAGREQRNMSEPTAWARPRGS